jgi:hypothetical protein
MLHCRDSERRTIVISQPQLIDALLERHRYEAARPVRAPLDRSSLTQDSEYPTDIPALQSYPAIVGSLLYLASTTRPDLTYAALALARFMAPPTTELLDHARRVLRYLVGTRELELHLGEVGFGGDLITAFCDASLADDPATARSVTGLVLYFLGSLVLWRSIKRGNIANSSTTAEYIGASTIADEVMWLHILLQEC